LLSWAVSINLKTLVSHRYTPINIDKTTSRARLALKQWGGQSAVEIQGIEEKVVFSLPKGLKKEKDLSAN
jgi:hypothetical protein